MKMIPMRLDIFLDRGYEVVRGDIIDYCHDVDDDYSDWNIEKNDNHAFLVTSSIYLTIED